MDSFTATKASHHANASPSVSLERGRYRMKAPAKALPVPLVFQATDPHVRWSPLYRVNRNFALLLFLLAFACLTCFGSAYYLFITRWDFRPLSAPIHFANSIFKVTASENTLNQRYLSYFPHSGQRIAFEILSSLHIFSVARYLYHQYASVTNQSIMPNITPCNTFSSQAGNDLPTVWTPSLPCPSAGMSSVFRIPWTSLVDLSALTDRQALFHRFNTSQTWIFDNFDILTSDIYTLRDNSMYNFDSWTLSPTRHSSTIDISGTFILTG